MPLERVLPDTNVCYPISVLDLILRGDEAALFTVVWTNDLLNELAETWAGNGVRSVESAGRICDQIRATFADQEIPRSAYQSLIDQMPGKDPDDHAHAAAAASRAPVTILTNNIRDFPRKQLAELGVTVIRPDDFFVDLATTRRAELAAVIAAMSATRSRPAMTIPEVLDALKRAGLPGLVARLR